MPSKNLVLRTMYIDPDVDDQLRTEAFDSRTSKNDLLRRYLRLGMEVAKARKMSAGAGATATATADLEVKKPPVKKAGPDRAIAKNAAAAKKALHKTGAAAPKTSHATKHAETPAAKKAPAKSAAAA